MKRTSAFLMFSFMCIGFTNCAKTNFSASAASSSSQSCASQLQTITVPIKTLFIVDTSGSNADDFYFPGSDNDKSLRGSAIQKYFDAYKARANFSWGFLTFSDFSASSLIGGVTNPMFSNAVQMQAAINSFYLISDYSLTPYRAALNLARIAISSDTDSTATTKYIIVFLSDGLPDPEVSDAVLHADIASILGTKPGQVTFNAIYYGQADVEASSRLMAMAKAGDGKFLDTNETGSTFDISSAVHVAGLPCGG